MKEIGAVAVERTRVYLTGGASAVLLKWRETTIDVDLEIVPDRDEIFRALPALKENLELNIELACPSHFIPALPGWEGRCLFISEEGLVSFYHYDFYSQALSKIERGHAQDRVDVKAMLARGLVEPHRLRELFDAIYPALYRYPAINPASFRHALDEALSARE